MLGAAEILSAEVARSTRELAEARARLSELLLAYDATAQSKFARLHFFFEYVRSLVPRRRPLLRRAIARERRGAGGEYDRWLRQHAARDSDLERMRGVARLLPYRPVISILVATYNSQDTYLRAALDSVRAQAYPAWELCIADDASTWTSVGATLDEYAAADARIKLVKRPTNGRVAQATNSALTLATGDFVGFLDHDDLLTPDALFEVALLLNRYRDADMLYSDEDKIDDAGFLSEPHFKPEWSPDSLLSRMYTCHFGVYRRALVEAIGGLRAGYDGSQDHDFVLRLTERTKRIHHIPRVLYHWRMHSTSTAAAAEAKPYAALAGRRAVQDAIERRGEPGVVQPAELPGIYIARYTIREPSRVSVIVPTRDHGADLERCLRSIFAHETYADFEIVLLDNGSTEPASLGVLERWKARDSRINVVRRAGPFNFAALNNYAVTRTTGKYLLFLNNDTEVLSHDWMEAMVEQAQRPSIGVVGALLFYPDGTVQHAGVVVGLGGVAGHAHSGRQRSDPGYFGMLRAINNVSALTAACSMVRRSVFDEAGGFDESLAVAFNDVDLCLKIGARGYRNVYLPHVQLLHFESKSRGREGTPAKRARFAQEIATMEQRWSTKTLTDPYYSRHLTLDPPGYAIHA